LFCLPFLTDDTPLTLREKSTAFFNTGLHTDEATQSNQALKLSFQWS